MIRANKLWQRRKGRIEGYFGIQNMFVIRNHLNKLLLSSINSSNQK